MITFEEAKKIADGLTIYNSCNEYKLGWHFFNKTKEEVTGDAGAVILKETGKAISFVSFLEYHPEVHPKKIDL